MPYTYIVECSDGTYYTGWTCDLQKRLNSHNSGCGAKYTRGRVPVKLVYSEWRPEKNEAQQREFEIKQLNRRQKEELIKKNQSK